MTSGQRIIPSQDQLTLPLLSVLDENGPMRARYVADAIAERVSLDPDERTRMVVVGDKKRVNAWDRTIRWVQQRTRLRGLTERDEDGRWALTQKAKNGLTPAAPGVVVTVFETEAGLALWGEAEALEGLLEPQSIDLVLVSPPYDIATAKEYGGRRGRDYEDWLVARAAAWRALLTESGSVMLNLGDSWIPGQPAQSLYQENVLLRLVNELGYSLLQRLYWRNPARLATPAAWVTVRRIRVTPAVEQIYWLSAGDPHKAKANNANVLRPYSARMRQTLKRGYTNAGRRPSGFSMTQTSFQHDLGGSIPQNIVEASNTASNDDYSRYCRDHNLPLHPARFPRDLARFCIGLTTDPGDVVFDPCGGSLTTLATAIEMERYAISGDLHREYVLGGRGRLAA
jgi:site-specific DNA-methyltransferase (cytosine-N4-specific)